MGSCAYLRGVGLGLRRLVVGGGKLLVKLSSPESTTFPRPESIPVQDLARGGTVVDLQFMVVVRILLKIDLGINTEIDLRSHA